MKSIRKYNWNQVYDSNQESYTESLLRIKSSQQWCYIENAIRKKHRNINGICSIEIGSGMGKASALLAMMGANVTLLDNNNKALESARNLFAYIGCKGKFILTDALLVPKNLENTFDIAMSIGTGEHFIGLQRKRIVESHYKVLKPKGQVYFVVPNSLCLRYNLLMNISAFLGCGLEKEYPFSKKEILGLAVEVGFKDAYAIGLNYKEAKERFRINSLIKSAANQYLPWLTRNIRILRRREYSNLQNSTKSKDINYYRGVLIAPSLELKMSSYDELFGYALVLSGGK